jgi:hypothetical protein
MLRHTDTFGPNVSSNIPLPTTANITAVELLSFFPNYLKSADVVDRLASNGVARNVHWTVFNTCRVLKKERSQNSCGVMVYMAM